MLVLFGNPPLGVQFLQSNPYSGLDWPVRMLVLEAAEGAVCVAWTDFAYIAERYAIADRGPQFAMASEVAASIAAAAGLNGHRAPASTWTIAAIGQPADHGTVAVLTFRERNRAWRIVFMHPAPSSTPTGDASCAPRA
jgi:hypothetical protein